MLFELGPKKASMFSNRGQQAVTWWWIGVDFREKIRKKEMKEGRKEKEKREKAKRKVYLGFNQYFIFI